MIHEILSLSYLCDLCVWSGSLWQAQRDRSRLRKGYPPAALSHRFASTLKSKSHNSKSDCYRCPLRALYFFLQIGKVLVVAMP
jgi:hypothetical protein